MSCGGETHEERERSESSGGAERREVGCCGDVPECVSSKATPGSGGGKRKERLLEWLKSSQTKREENNRQVLARWIDMVDHGVIDLASVYPSKPTSVKVVSSEPLKQSGSSALPSIKPNVPPQYFSSVSPSYYSVPQNWFASNHPAALYSPQSFNVYSGSYCPSSHYYQYMPFQQQCTMCPSSYIVPNTEMNCNNQEGNLNINSEKWLDVLGDVKINDTDDKRNEDVRKEES